MKGIEENRWMNDNECMAGMVPRLERFQGAVMPQSLCTRRAQSSYVMAWNSSWHWVPVSQSKLSVSTKTTTFDLWRVFKLSDFCDVLMTLPAFHSWCPRRKWAKRQTSASEKPLRQQLASLKLSQSKNLKFSDRVKLNGPLGGSPSCLILRSNPPKQGWFSRKRF